MQGTNMGSSGSANKTIAFVAAGLGILFILLMLFSSNANGSGVGFGGGVGPIFLLAAVVTIPIICLVAMSYRR